MTDLRKSAWESMTKHPGHANQSVHGHGKNPGINRASGKPSATHETHARGSFRGVSVGGSTGRKPPVLHHEVKQMMSDMVEASEGHGIHRDYSALLEAHGHAKAGRYDQAVEALEGARDRNVSIPLLHTDDFPKSDKPKRSILDIKKSE